MGLPQGVLIVFVLDFQLQQRNPCRGLVPVRTIALLAKVPIK